MKSNTSLQFSKFGQTGFSIKKHPDTDLLLLHRTLLTKKLHYMDLKLRTKKQIIKLYDNTINPENIRNYYNTHIDKFLEAMVTNKLHTIAKFTNLKS